MACKSKSVASEVKPVTKPAVPKVVEEPDEEVEEELVALKECKNPALLVLVHKLSEKFDNGDVNTIYQMVKESGFSIEATTAVVVEEKTVTKGKKTPTSVWAALSGVHMAMGHGMQGAKQPWKDLKFAFNGKADKPELEAEFDAWDAKTSEADKLRLKAEYARWAEWVKEKKTVDEMMAVLGWVKPVK